MADKMHAQLLAYLKDAHALEQMSLTMTASAAKAAKDATLRALFQRHHEETQEHERLIRERIEAHGEKTSTLKDVGGRVAALAKGVAAMVPSDTPGRLARDGYVQEHTEIASYEMLRRVAERAGDLQTAEVAQRILDNERETAEKIAGTWDLAADLSLDAAGATGSSGGAGAGAAASTATPAAAAVTTIVPPAEVEPAATTGNAAGTGVAETSGGSDVGGSVDRPLGTDPDVEGDEGVPMPPEPVPSPGEVDRARLGEEDVSEQAP
jgi:ferritin-like metal-binding protein YciE